VVAVLTDEDKNTCLRVERRVARFHAEDIPIFGTFIKIPSGRVSRPADATGRLAALRFAFPLCFLGTPAEHYDSDPVLRRFTAHTTTDHGCGIFPYWIPYSSLVKRSWNDPGSNALWGTSYVFSRYLMKPMGWITAAVPVPNTS
jgi:hypothetical protein